MVRSWVVMVACAVARAMPDYSPAGQWSAVLFFASLDRIAILSNVLILSHDSKRSAGVRPPPHIRQNL
jgi:hypothetical protein